MLWLVKAPLIASVAIAVGVEIWNWISDSDNPSSSPSSDSHSSSASVSRSASPDDHSGTFSKSSTRVDSSNKKEVLKEIRVVEEKRVVEERIIRGLNASLTLPKDDHSGTFSKSSTRVDSSNKNEVLKEVRVVQEKRVVKERIVSGSNVNLTPPKEGTKLRKENLGIKHYYSSHKILLVGEGDFSFSACLAKAFGSANNMVATSLDSLVFLEKNYKNASSNILEIRNRGGIVLNNVDATKMTRNCLLEGVAFDRIIYNFPHAGFSFENKTREAQISRNQKLVSLFMKNAKKMLKKDGEIHVSHKSYGFFLAWDLETLASNCGLSLIEEVKFRLNDYPVSMHQMLVSLFLENAKQIDD
ncbi:hypothetical protein GIB67_001087 [Kingdonia uniflora]|uniref:25S rRNA (uridine-N(3))-methyltransferase BMT5-like domain-containing protein n=1 Tax=Kingdonia uniflora TaxID=39325 RepID=A0A7J7MGG9_9MAGN|nr:hypothetical protein GIB67_001087 [Kingdonia uniflora]